MNGQLKTTAAKKKKKKSPSYKKKKRRLVELTAGLQDKSNTKSEKAFFTVLFGLQIKPLTTCTTHSNKKQLYTLPHSVVRPYVFRVSLRIKDYGLFF
jgi:hypothetical protein